MRSCVVAVVLLACKGDRAPAPSTPPAPPEPAAYATDDPCTPLPFATEIPVAEASGAAWLELDGKPSLLVISDSGHAGAYAIVDADTGELRERGALPLGEGSDDVEGIASRGGTIYGLSSAGWMRAWQRDGAGFRLVDGPYPIAPVTLSARGGLGDKPPSGTGLVCPGEGVNCGRNYEGLAILPRAGSCAGYACSKADGHLYCLSEHDGRFAAAFEGRIAVDRPGVIGDCASDETGAVWVGNNLFGRSQVSRVDPATGAAPLASLGAGFPEGIAVRGDVIYRFSDTGGSPSLAGKFRCRAIAR